MNLQMKFEGSDTVKDTYMARWMYKTVLSRAGALQTFLNIHIPKKDFAAPHF